MQMQVCSEPKAPVVAIIGRPNVGKSALFNRIIQKRKAIVDNLSGTTRDRVYADVEWDGVKFQLVDTGGVDLAVKKGVSPLIIEQVKYAVEDADIIILVCDITTGIVPGDEDVCSLIRKTGKRVILVLNKADNKKLRSLEYDFYKLGLKELFIVSALHGIGIGDLLDEIVKDLKQYEPFEDKDRISKICIVGRPNAGKSSFINCLLNQNRVIVDSTAGTTRDAVEISFKIESREYTIIDTAGILRSAKVKEAVGKFSLIRSKKSIERSDVAVVLLDAAIGLAADDMRILGIVQKAERGCVLAVNKWDLVTNTTADKYREYLIKKAPFVKDIPIVLTSALTGRKVISAIKKAGEIVASFETEFSTVKLNKILEKIKRESPPPKYKLRQAMMYYITQTAVRPPRFTIFVNNYQFFRANYITFLENKLREKLKIKGVPVRVKLENRRQKPKK